MGLSNGIITKPLSTDDIGSCIGADSEDIGTLCQHPNVKQWAKYKPIDLSIWEELTEDQRKANGYGFKVDNLYRYVLSSPNLTKLLTDVKAKNYSLFYQRPTDLSRFRFFDFVQYNHNCINPFVFTKLQEVGFGSLAAGQRTDTLPDFNITLEDLTSTLGVLADIGYGVAVHAPDNSYYLIGIDVNNNLLYPPYVDGIRQEYDIIVSKENASGSVVTGTYECAFVIINRSRGEIYTLPMPVLTLNVMAAGYITIFPAGLITKKNASGSKSKLTYIIEYRSVNGGTGTIPAGSVRAEIYDLSGRTIQTNTIDYHALYKVGDYYEGEIDIEYPFNEISGGRISSARYGIEVEIEIDSSEMPDM